MCRRNASSSSFHKIPRARLPRFRCIPYPQGSTDDALHTLGLAPTPIPRTTPGRFVGLRGRVAKHPHSPPQSHVPYPFFEHTRTHREEAEQ